MRLAALSALVLLAGCDSADDASDLTLTNGADRPVVATVYSQEDLQYIDLRGAISSDEFDEAALGVGASELQGLSEREVGEDLRVIVYARRDAPTPWIEEQYGPGAAEVVTSFEVSWDALRASDYRVVVRDAE